MPLRNRHYLLLDVLLLLSATVLSFAIRFEGLRDLDRHLPDAAAYFITTIPVRVGVLWLAGIYRRLWRYATVADLSRLVGAGGLAAFANLCLGAVILPGIGAMTGRVPLAVLALDGAMTIGLTALLRMMQRDLDRRQMQRRHLPVAQRGKAVLIAGAGSAGRMIAEELTTNPRLGLRAVGFLDDDPGKHNELLAGIPVVGALDTLEDAVRVSGATELIVALPTAPGSVIRSIAANAKRIALPTRTVPGLFDLVSGRLTVSSLRRLRIEDLLRREPIETDPEAVWQFAQSARILITGAGGSIGSELCRQLAGYGPASLALVGHGENSIFDIHAELCRRFPSVVCEPFIADIRHHDRLAEVFAQFRPDMVFHAAAHKHVPLMETNPGEAVTNNIVGTRHVVELAAWYDVERLVLISTDKAVRPTSVMGASKRVAENLVQDVAERTGRNYVAVRFGNVLGSRGSVVPTFIRQIEVGGPVTITHPDVRRYFMTIPESVQLVLQAAVLGRGGETFALDMGEPVRIVDLAEDLIRLSGLEPGNDIKIEFTGLRPGEKLYEEVFFDADSAEPTEHPKVLRSRNTSLPEGLRAAVTILEQHARDGADRDVIRRALKDIVPDYEPPDLTVCGTITPLRATSAVAP